MSLRDVVLEDSPLAQYLASQNVDVPRVTAGAADAPSGRGLRVPAFLSVRRVAARLPLFNECYRRVVGGGEEAALERRFPDVKSALREEQAVPRVAPVWLAMAVGGAVLVTVTVGVWLGLLVLALLLWLGSEPLHPLPPPPAVEALAAAFLRLDKQLRKSVCMVREVELVARGYRVGSTVQSPVSLLEAAESGEARRLAQLRLVCRDGVQSVMKAAEQMLQSVDCRNVVVSFDVAQLLELVRGVDTADATLQNMATWVRALHLVSMGLCVLTLRIVLVDASHERVLVPLLKSTAEACFAAADRIQDARSVDWRRDPAKAGKAAPVLDPAIAALQSGLRTLGAKSTLFGETANGEEQAKLREQIGADLSRLAEEWQHQCENLQSRAGAAVSSPPRPRQAAGDVETTTTAGGLQIDVFGGGVKERGAVSAPANLEQLLEVYEARIAGEEEEGCRIPTKSREERIREMYERKAAEEHARAASRTVSALMSELENVLHAKAK
jgi:hypothetical protein